MDVTASVGKDVWQRAQSDPEFVLRFERRYQGTWVPADALWWACFPTTSSSSGAEPPYLDVDSLRNDLYRRRPEVEHRIDYLERSADYWREWSLAASAVAQALAEPARARRRMPLVVAGVVVAAVVAILLAAVVRIQSPGPTAAAPVVSMKPQSVLPVREAVSAPNSPGTTLLRMSSAGPVVGGQFASGTKAYESAPITSRRPILLTVSCRGGSRLLLVAGQDGLNAGSFMTIDCPGTETATASTVLPASATDRAFRLVAYERDPLTWKLLLSTYPS